MAARRMRLGRLLVVAAIAVLLWFLLEMNRYLPGVWPGGGGTTGSRPMPVAGSPDPGAVAPSSQPPMTPPKSRGPTRVIVATPEGTPDPKATTMILGPSGTALPAIGPSTGTGSSSPGEALDWPQGRVEGLLVQSPRGRLTHGAPPPGLGSTLRIQWPRGSLPAGAPSSTQRKLQVVDDDGKPVVGASVRWNVGTREMEGTSDADGTVSLAGGSLPRFRVCASASGHGDVCVYGSLEDASPLVLTLPRLVRAKTSFVDAATGTAMRATTLKLVGADHIARTVTRPEGGFDGFDQTLPADQASTGFLEIEAEGRPPMRVPLRSLAATTPVPTGRSVAVTVVDPKGQPKAGALVTARYAPGPEAEAGDAGLLRTEARTDAEGKATLSVPADLPADVLVSADDLAGAGFRSAPGEGAGPKEVRLPEGSKWTVRVKDREGRPVPDARVLAFSGAGDSTLRREATTDAQGTATLPPVGAGRTEVYAHAAGKAWASTSFESKPGGGTVDLVLDPGARLHLVVEDPYGVPVPHVSVRSVPRGDAKGQAPDAYDPDGTPWVTDTNGVLIVEDLSERDLDLYLHAPGFTDEVVSRVKPGDSTWFATLTKGQ